MIRTPDAHPINQSNNEVLGHVAGGFSLSESQCECGDCGADLEHGDAVTGFFAYGQFSITHRWNRRALFCRECNIRELDDEALEGYRRSTYEVLVRGTLRDKGYMGTYADGKRWTYQDGKWADFAALDIKDRKGQDQPNGALNVTEIGPRHFTYIPSRDGATVPVPAGVLRALVEEADTGDNPPSKYKPADDNTARMAEALLDYYATA